MPRTRRNGTKTWQRGFLTVLRLALNRQFVADGHREQVEDFYRRYNDSGFMSDTTPTRAEHVREANAIINLIVGD